MTIAGKLVAAWLKFVYATARKVERSERQYDVMVAHDPVIIALWHGQHFMSPLARRKDHPMRALVSRSGDGHINSVALESMGMGVIRGSGGRNRAKTIKKGGIPALKALVDTLNAGLAVSMTVNVPKGGARECGMGVVTLARLSGRPVFPVAFATSNRIDLNSWDKASINLPFGKCALIVGDPIFIARKGTEEELENKRLEIELALNEATRKAYACFDGKQS